MRRRNIKIRKRTKNKLIYGKGRFSTLNNFIKKGFRFLWFENINYIVTYKKWKNRKKRIYGRGFFTGYSNLLGKIIKKTV